MYPDEQNQFQVNEKVSREEAMKREISGIAAACSEQTTACEENLRSRLRRQQRNSESEYQKTAHALEILDKHPEFEDFLWLIRSGVVRL